MRAAHPTLTVAADRLRGHLVSCPVIGDLCLPGFAVPADLRLKAELLQPGGSLWYRGTQHWLLRQLGRWKGLACVGAGAEVLAWARAARDQRTPLVALVPAGPSVLPRETRATLAALGCDVEEIAADGIEAALSGRYAGYVRTPRPDDDEFAVGIATVALELADELPSETERLVVAPAELAGAVARGAALLELPWMVEGAPSSHRDGEAVAGALRGNHRLCTAAAGAAALAAAIARHDEHTCVLLGV